MISHTYLYLHGRENLAWKSQIIEWESKMKEHMRISKKEFYSRGGLTNSRLFRKQTKRGYSYFLIISSPKEVGQMEIHEKFNANEAIYKISYTDDEGKKCETAAMNHIAAHETADFLKFQGAVRIRIKLRSERSGYEKNNRT